MTPAEWAKRARPEVTFSSEALTGMQDYAEYVSKYPATNWRLEWDSDEPPRILDAEGKCVCVLSTGTLKAAYSTDHILANARRILGSTLLVLLIAIAPALAFSQAISFPCYAEITIDTVPAVKIYYDGWKQTGFYVTQAENRDTIGERVEEVTRFFYIRDGEKVYLSFLERKYLNGIKDEDRRFQGF